MRLVRCRACSMVYVNPVQEEIASKRFYEHRSFYVSSDKLEGDYAPVRFERELRIFRAWCPAGTVLDVGCSTGGFLNQLKARYPEAYETLGNDVAGAALDYAESRGVRVTREAFLDMDAAKMQFDAITFWAVMEHLVDPGKFLHKSAQMLKPGGYCFVLVPNFQSLAVRLLGLRYRYITPEHLNYFSPATLKAFARREAVFQIVDAGSTHFNPMVIWQDFRSRGRIVPDQERAQLLKRTTVWKQSVFLTPVKFIYTRTERFLGSMNLADNLFVVLRRTPDSSES